MSRHHSFPHWVIFGKLAHGPRHVAVLAMLGAQPRLVEVITPFEKGLILLADDTRALRMAICARSRCFDALVNHRCVRRVNSIRPPYFPLGGKVARGAGNASLLEVVTGFGRIDLGASDI